MKTLLVLAVLSCLVPASAAEKCPEPRPFIAGGPEVVPPIARLILFWPREKPKTARVGLTIKDVDGGKPLPFTLQRISRTDVWDAYSLTVIAGAKTTFRLAGDAGHPDLKGTFFGDPGWKRPDAAPAYRLEWTEGGRRKSVVLPPESACFPWPKGARPFGLFADGSEGEPAP